MGPRRNARGRINRALGVVARLPGGWDRNLECEPGLPEAGRPTAGRSGSTGPTCATRRGPAPGPPRGRRRGPRRRAPGPERPSRATSWPSRMSRRSAGLGMTACRVQPSSAGASEPISTWSPPRVRAKKRKPRAGAHGRRGDVAAPLAQRRAGPGRGRARGRRRAAHGEHVRAQLAEGARVAHGSHHAASPRGRRTGARPARRCRPPSAWRRGGPTARGSRAGRA